VERDWPWAHSRLQEHVRLVARQTTHSIGSVGPAGVNWAWRHRNHRKNAPVAERKTLLLTSFAGNAVPNLALAALIAVLSFPLTPGIVQIVPIFVAKGATNRSNRRRSGTRNGLVEYTCSLLKNEH